MRTIKLSQILVFALLQAAIITLAILTTLCLARILPSNDFRSLILLASGIVLFYSYAILTLRIFLHFFPVPAGSLPKDSSGEFIYHICLLFYLLFLWPLLRSPLPTPLMRVIYVSLGASFGTNSHCSGVILDPHFVTIGNHSMIGMNAFIVPHVNENDNIAHYPITIGNNVTVGAQSIVQAGVTIGDNSIVAMGSVVRKNTTINAGEVWGGVPARLIKKLNQT